MVHVLQGAPVVGRYVVDVAAFESLALPTLQPQADSTQLVVVDEVGKTCAYMCQHVTCFTRDLHWFDNTLYAQAASA